MRNSLTNSLKLISPFLASILIFLILFLSIPVQLQLNFPITSLASISVPITNHLTIQIFLGLLAFGCLAIPMFRNYEGYFPTAMKLEVFFDKEGLETGLHVISKDYRKLFNIADDWKNHRQSYLEKLNKSLRRHNAPIQLEFDESSSGEGLFYLSIKSSRLLQQQYKVTDAEAIMRFPFTDQQNHSVVLLMYNTLQKTASNFISGPLYSIYYQWTKVVRLTFKPTIQIGPGQHLPLDETITLTKVRFFPTTRISDTLYLIKKSCIPNCSGNELIPIAYARYIGI